MLRRYMDVEGLEIAMQTFRPFGTNSDRDKHTGKKTIKRKSKVVGNLNDKAW